MKTESYYSFWDAKANEDLDTDRDKKFTCNFLNRSPCVLLFPCFPCFAFQNCFWAEYLLMGHTLKRQSGEEVKYSGTQELLFVSQELLKGLNVVKLHF